MAVPLLIIITGPSASGKTTLGKRLAAELQLPFLYKDGIKERLFDSLGWSDRAWSRKLGQATYTLLFHFVEIELAAGVSCIVESNFNTLYATPDFRAIQQKYPFRPFQIQCVTDGAILIQRFHERASGTERHPGHAEEANLQEFEASLQRGYMDPIDIGGTLYTLDTTDFSNIDYKKMHMEINIYLKDLKRG